MLKPLGLFIMVSFAADRMRFVDGSTAPLPPRPDGALGCDMHGEDPVRHAPSVCDVYCVCCVCCVCYVRCL